MPAASSSLRRMPVGSTRSVKSSRKCRGSSNSHVRTRPSGSSCLRRSSVSGPARRRSSRSSTVVSPISCSDSCWSPTARVDSGTSIRSRGAFDALVQEAHGRIEVDVITASEAEASPELLEAVRARVQSVLGKEPVLHHYADPAMIGGIKMRIGDQLVDGSVATRLRRMKEEILGKGATQVRSESERFLEGAS